MPYVFLKLFATWSGSCEGVRMKKNAVVMALIGIVISVGLAACASVKDENGKTVGTCIGAGCVLRAAFGANTIDSKTGHMPGEIPLFSIGGASAAASAPVAANTQ